MVRRSSALIVILVALGIGFVYLARPRAPGLLAHDAVAVPVGETLEIYFTLENIGGPDALLAAASAAAGRAVIVHPEAFDITPIPAGSRPVFARDGVYLRLEDPQQGLQAGALIPLVLTFAEAGEVALKARVAGAEAAAMDPHALHRNMEIDSGDSSAELSLEVTRQADGEGWDLAVETRNFEFFRPDQPESDVPDRPGQGHAHLYLNGLKLGRLYSNGATIGALPPGRYTVRVALNSNRHRPVMAGGNPVEARAEITAQ